MSTLKKKIPDEFTDLCYSKSNNPWTPEEIDRCKAILSECELDATYAGSYKYTALHQTSLPLEIVEWLVERGADVNAPNTYGTPLYEHAGMRNYEICKFLIEHGADVEATNYEGQTPLFAAADMGDVAVVKLLLDNGADPNHHNRPVYDNQTPLLYMIRRMEPGGRDNSEVAKILIDACGGKEGIPTEEWELAREYIRKKGEQHELARANYPEYSFEDSDAEMNRFYEVFEVEPAKPIIKHDGVSPIIVDMSLPIGKIHDELWDYLVPGAGKCKNVQGEVIRVTGRVADETYRNGGINWDSNYSKMLKALEKYFRMGTPLEDSDIEKVKNAALEIDSNKGCCSEEAVELLEEMAVKWVSLNSNPIPLGRASYKR